MGESESGKRLGSKAGFFVLSCFLTEKRFIMFSLIGVLKEKGNENKVFFRY
jgi:hypothetical protein